MTSQELLSLDASCHWQNGQRYPLLVARGSSSTLFDSEGNACLDFSGAMGKSCIGYDNTHWIDALADQLLQQSCVPPQLCCEPITRLALALCARSGLAKAGFCSSGTEAQRAMLSLARAYSRARYGEGRSTILSLQSKQAHLAPDMRALPADMDAIRQAANGDVCAVRLALLPSDGDMNPLSQKFVHELTVFCAEQNWLILLDERNSGAGRSGTLFLFEQYGLSPDIVLFSDALSGGLPFGGLLLSHRCADLSPDCLSQEEIELGTTPLCAAGALAVLDLLNEEVLAAARDKGDYLRQGIEALQLPMFTSVGGVGLLVSLRCAAEIDPGALALRLLAHGLLTLHTESGLLLLPPLTVSKDELRRALSLLGQALSEGET